MSDEEKIKEISHLIHLEYLSKADTLNNMTVISYGYLTQAVEQAMKIYGSYMINKMNIPNYIKQGAGEWCEKCGAWKQYGVADSHICRGYTVTS